MKIEVLNSSSTKNTGPTLTISQLSLTAAAWNLKNVAMHH